MNKTSNNFEFEICANSVESCLAAQEGGADRVELCAGISEGGTTPSFGDIVTARRLLSDTKLHVIIRPRGGDFTYSDLEMDIMAADIDACKQAGVDGVVPNPRRRYRHRTQCQTDGACGQYGCNLSSRVRQMP